MGEKSDQNADQKNDKGQNYIRLFPGTWVMIHMYLLKCFWEIHLAAGKRPDTALK